MSKGLKVKLNSAGVRELLLSSEIEAACTEVAKQVRNRCGDGYAMNSYKGKNRVNVSVSAETYQAKRDNIDNNTLLKAVSK